jgi:hypothetical protein
MSSSWGAACPGYRQPSFCRRQRPRTRVLVLDANSEFGGNARRDDQPPLPVMASTAGSYCVEPYADFQRELYGAIGLDWERYKVAAPFYSYYFDEHTPGIVPGRRGWHLDAYGKGTATLPYPPEIVRQLLRCKEEFAAWQERDGAPTDPPDDSDPKYDYLSRMSLHDYLVRELRCNPIVSDFYTRYTVDALGGTAQQVNAHSSICFLAGEYAAPFAFPGGNAGLARLLIKWLNGDAVPGEAMATPVHADALDRYGSHSTGRDGSPRRSGQRRLLQGWAVLPRQGQSHRAGRRVAHGAASRRPYRRPAPEGRLENVQHGPGRRRQCRGQKRRAVRGRRFRVQPVLVGQQVLGGFRHR